MKFRCKYFGCTVLALLLGDVAMAGEPTPLLHNPFSRPPAIDISDDRPVFAEDGTVRVVDLHATMVSTTDALANVGGRTLRPGDEIQGYTLVQIFEDRAIFSREGKQITVFVKPERLHDDG